MRYELHLRNRRFPIYTLEIWRILHAMRRAIVGYIADRAHGRARERQNSA